MKYKVGQRVTVKSFPYKRLREVRFTLFTGYPERDKKLVGLACVIIGIGYHTRTVNNKLVRIPIYQVDFGSKTLSGYRYKNLKGWLIEDHFNGSGLRDFSAVKAKNKPVGF